jgi:Fe-S-cluster-containing dehydrogenase component
MQTALEKGLVQGHSILVIDLNVCTRCDECVRGCADTHEGRPRFVREGDKHENLLITKACYHCHDPVCLVGCPTGAIRRASVGDVVEIVDDLCIGCQACANNCPYDAIVMHETGETWAENMIPELLRGKPRLLASKCDLCYKNNHGPACVHNCPHGCAIRIGSVEEFQRLVMRR